jgi:hypothetical protein
MIKSLLFLIALVAAATAFAPVQFSVKDAQT